jgi:hypothetical protein
MQHVRPLLLNRHATAQLSILQLRARHQRRYNHHGKHQESKLPQRGPQQVTGVEAHPQQQLHGSRSSQRKALTCLLRCLGDSTEHGPRLRSCTPRHATPRNGGAPTRTKVRVLALATTRPGPAPPRVVAASVLHLRLKGIAPPPSARPPLPSAPLCTTLPLSRSARSRLSTPSSALATRGERPCVCRKCVVAWCVPTASLGRRSGPRWMGHRCRTAVRHEQSLVRR